MTDTPGFDDLTVGSTKESMERLKAMTITLPSATPSTADRRRAKSPVFFVVLVVLAVIKAWLMRGFALGSWNPIWAVAFETAFVVLLLGVFDLIPPKRWYWLDFLIYSLLSVLLFAITVYVHFYTQLFDPSMMAMAGQVGTVGDAVAQLIKPIYVLFLIDLPFIALWIANLGKQARQQRRRLDQLAEQGVDRLPTRLIQPQSRSLRVALFTLVAAIVLAGQIVAALRVPSYVDRVAVAKSRGLTIAQAAVFLPRGADDANDDDESQDIVAPGERVASASTTAAPAASKVPTSAAGKFAARVERIRGSLEGSRISTFTPGAFKGKNVIIVQVEALNTMCLENKIAGKEITPNLNKIIQESWYFPNTYSETGIGNTADAEFIVNSSLYAPRAQAAPVLYADRKIPAMPRLLNRLGYDTFTVHTNRVQYWNRKELYSALGFRHYYEAPYFHFQDRMAMGSSDEVLFAKADDILGAAEASSAPYYAQFITMSSHTPFEYIPNKRRPLKLPANMQGSFVGNYLTAESYADKALGNFFDYLKTSGIWDKSIVVIYGDHTSQLDNSLSGTDADIAEKLLGRPYGPADRQRVSMIIHLPGQTQPTVRQDVCGEVDIMPTVCDLLGVDLSEVPHMGRSVFVDSNALVPFNSYLPGGSFANDRILFMPGLGFDDGSAVSVLNDKSAKTTSRDETDYKRMLQLTRLADKWVMSLPKRSDAADLGKAWIPNNEARRAAEPLGAKQTGTGGGN
jgi:phosphoglycerol transferase MdoB-like AlkP superfamily enzyme